MTYLTYERPFILVVVVFAFFFCWTPFHSQRVMFCLGKRLEKSRLRAIFDLIYFLSFKEGKEVVFPKDLKFNTFFQISGSQ